MQKRYGNIKSVYETYFFAYGITLLKFLIPFYKTLRLGLQIFSCDFQSNFTKLFDFTMNGINTWNELKD